jgi:hypothetical protein
LLHRTVFSIADIAHNILFARRWRNVLRFIRCHQLREPKLVCSHGGALFGTELSKTIADESSRLTALEQICLAAVDVQDHKLSSLLLS